MTETPPQRDGVRLAFEQDCISVPIENLVPLRILRSGVKESRKYAQILSSVRAVGLVEPPVVVRDPGHPGQYFLLDGHLRVEALKDIGEEQVECLISTDDEAYTYNKQINRLSAIQEHRMIRRAIERGVPEVKISEALGLNVQAITRRSRMLNGICPEAVELLKDTPCPALVFDMLRKMAPLRQIEAAELMVGQNNFSSMFAKALLAATPEKQLAAPRRTKAGTSAVTSDRLARMERELAALQAQVTSFDETFGVDNLHLTVARGYIRTLIVNARVSAWLAARRPEYLREFHAVAEIERVGAGRAPGAG